MNNLGSEYYTMQKALTFMKNIPGLDNPTNPLRECLHIVVWHKAIDRVRWLMDNKELVLEIAATSKFPLEGELRERFLESVRILKELDR